MLVSVGLGDLVPVPGWLPLAGRPLSRRYPQLVAHGFSVANRQPLSNDRPDVDTVSFGVTADYESVPDLDVFAAGIGRGLAQLDQAG
jgi:hypothetical protein